MKKLITVLLALVMIFSMPATAMAVEGNYDENTNDGRITINKYNDKNKYSIYRMLNLESFNTETASYAYKINTGWEGFFIGTGVGENFVPGEGAEYVDISTDGNNYVTWKKGLSDTVSPEFAQKALAYAKDNEINPVADSEGYGHTDKIKGTVGTLTDDQGNAYPTYTFSGLPFGYYLADSSMGALCGLTTTNPHASINAKNGEPILELQVNEDSNSQWSTSNTARIGQKVEYRATITVQAGAEAYKLHGLLADGLTFNNEVVVFYDGVEEVNTNNTKYSVLTSAADFPNNCGTDCDFVVDFKDAFCNKLEAGKTLVVYFTAILNENAVIAGDGNVAITKLGFGEITEDHFTLPGEVTTRTFAFDLIKTDAQNSLLDGAWFEMYVSATGGEPLKLFYVQGEKPYYRPWMESDGADKVVTEFEVDGGQLRFQGFDSDSYYFDETKWPSGYNRLSGRAHFVLPEYNKDAIFNTDSTGKKIYSSGSGFHITNLTGAMLPETGGLGTLLFTVLGGTTVLGTGVVLVTKKRMSKIDDED